MTYEELMDSLRTDYTSIAHKRKWEYGWNHCAVSRIYKRKSDDTLFVWNYPSFSYFNASRCDYDEDWKNHKKTWPCKFSCLTDKEYFYTTEGRDRRGTGTSIISGRRSGYAVIKGRGE